MQRVYSAVKNCSSKKVMVFAGFFLLLLMLSLTIMFLNAGSWLVAEDEVVESDAILVLMGSIGDRVLEGVDLYHQGYAPRLIFIQENMTAREELEDRGAEIPGRAELSKMAALQMGVFPQDIIIVQGNSFSTRDEAVYFREFLKENQEINSIILVTSKFHSARSKKIFERALRELDREVVIISQPTRYDPFDSQAWWKDREDAKFVVLEFLKLLNFYLIEQFR